MKNLIAQRRKEAGVSQQELASRLAVTASMIGKLERGERELSLRWLEEIGSALNVPWHTLVEVEETAPLAGFIGEDSEVEWSSPEFFRREPERIQNEAAIATSPAWDFAIRSIDIRVPLPFGSSVRIAMDEDWPLDDLVGRLCLIRMRTEPEASIDHVLGTLLRGDDEGFTILKATGGFLRRIAVAAAYPVSSIDLPDVHK